MITVNKLDNIEADAGVREGNIRMGRSDSEASLIVAAPELPPLSSGEDHVKLRIVGDEFSSNVYLDSEQLDDLRAALEECTTEPTHAEERDDSDDS